MNMEERKSDQGSDEEDNRAYQEMSPQDTPAGLIDSSKDQLVGVNLGPQLSENKLSCKTPNEDDQEDKEINSEKGGSDDEVDRNKQKRGLGFDLGMLNALKSKPKNLLPPVMRKKSNFSVKMEATQSKKDIQVSELDNIF